MSHKIRILVLKLNLQFPLTTHITKFDERNISQMGLWCP